MSYIEIKKMLDGSFVVTNKESDTGVLISELGVLADLEAANALASTAAGADTAIVTVEEMEPDPVDAVPVVEPEVD